MRSKFKKIKGKFKSRRVKVRLPSLKWKRKTKVLAVVVVTIALFPVMQTIWHDYIVHSADPCPVTDGGAGDGDSVVNGTILISSNTAWTATAGALGVVDCTGVDITVDTGVTLTLNPANDGDEDYTEDYAFTLQTDNLTVDGTISADGKGYAGGNGTHREGYGPGGGNVSPSSPHYEAGGGSFGGIGGTSIRNFSGKPIYGTPADAEYLGSGGGNSTYDGTPGVGGGGIKIESSGNLVLNGSITANGTNASGRDGGGSGGGIVLDVSATFSGAGSITANGGNGATGGGSGGGGRILANTSATTFTGTFSVLPGANYQGEKGSAVIIDTATNEIQIRADQLWVPTTESSFVDWFGSTYNFKLTNNSTLDLRSANRFTASSGYGWTFSVDSFTIDSGSTLSGYGHGYSYDSSSGDGYGPGGGDRSASSYNYNASGAGHGGAGGNSSNGMLGGSTYGSATNPIAPGSGGGDSSYNGSPGIGGGAIRITAQSSAINGAINFNATDATGRDGAGSGGSIWILSNGTFSGNGAITANGGSNNSGEGGGGGGGGRIAIYYSTKTHTGTITATGGTGWDAGEDGTVEQHVFPSISTLYQYKSDGSTAISTGGSTPEKVAVFKIDATDGDASDSLTPEIEIRPITESFKDTATHTGSSVAHSGGTTTAEISLTNAGVSGQGNLYRPVTITNNTASELTDFQVQVDVTYDSDMQADFDDVHFKTTGGTTLSHWKETYTSSTDATFWVKVPSIPASSATTINMYYGDSGAADTSDGSNTFVFFDDFSGSSIDQTKWTISNSTGWSVSGGELSGTNTSGRLTSVNTYSDGYELRVKSRRVTMPTNGYMVGGFFGSTSNSIGFLNHPTNDFYRNNGSWVAVSTTTPTGTDTLTKITTKSSSLVDLSVTNYSTGTSYQSYSNISNTVATEPITIGQRYDNLYTNQTYEAYWDWITLTKYTTTSPTVSVGSESINTTTATSLQDNTSYHWQARVCDQYDLCTAWTEYGGNSEGEVDFKTQKLLAYWPMDEGSGQYIYDGTGNNNTGVRGSNNGVGSGDPTWKSQSSCKFNSCLSFNGSSNLITINDSSSWDFPGDFSISGWFKADSAGSGSRRQIFTYDGAETGYISLMLRSANDLLFESRDSNDVYLSRIDTRNFYDNTWHHFAVTRDAAADTLNLYVDGTLSQGGADTRTGNFNQSDPVYLGRYTTSTYYWDGHLDDIKVFNTALSSDEVLVEYAAGSAINFGVGSNEASDLSDGSGNNPYAFWSLNEKSGTTASDTGGNEYTATLGGDGSGSDLPAWRGSGDCKTGACLYFDGGDYLSAGDINTPAANDAVTIQAWVKWDDLTGHRAIFTDGGYVRGIEFGLYNNELHLAVENNDSHRSLGYATSNLSTNTWYHVTGVADGPNGDMFIYVNGKLVASNTSLSAFTDYDGGDGTTIGNAGTQSPSSNEDMVTQNYFHLGLIDEVKIYNYARTAAQIAYDYNRGAPIAWWKMDDNVSGDSQTINDLSGNGNHGTTSDGANNIGMDCTVSGKFNLGCQLDGDDYVSIANESSFDFNQQYFTVTGWYKTNSTGYAIAKGAGSSDNGWGIATQSSIGVTFKGGSGVTATSRSSNSTNLDDNQWHHFAVVMYYDTSSTNNNDIQIYVDGILDQGAISKVTTPSLNNHNVEFGRRQTPAANYYTGSLDDFRIYNYALSPAQIKKVMNDGVNVRFGPNEGAP